MKEAMNTKLIKVAPSAPIAVTMTPCRVDLGNAARDGGPGAEGPSGASGVCRFH
jgi:hypothetical protein